MIVDRLKLFLGGFPAIRTFSKSNASQMEVTVEKIKDPIADFFRLRRISDVMGIVFLLMVFLDTLVAVTIILFLLPPETTVLFWAQPELSRWSFILAIIFLPAVIHSIIAGLIAGMNRRCAE